MDRFDLQIDVPAVSAADLALPAAREGTAEVAARVEAARCAQRDRTGEACNVEISTSDLERVATPDDAGRNLLIKAAESLQLTARGYHRVLRVARTIADLDGSESVRRLHIAESLGLRRRSGQASDTAQSPSRIAAF